MARRLTALLVLAVLGCNGAVAPPPAAKPAAAPPRTTAPASTAAPPPPAAPAPAAPVATIDITQATIFNSALDVATWAETAKITQLDLQANGVFVDFTKKDGPTSWPDFVPPGWNGPIEYTVWIFLYVNGQWYGSGCIDYWRGLDRNGGPPSGFAQNWYYDPIRWQVMTGHQPAKGELVGFMVTAGAQRNNDGTLVKERSNIVVVPFPDDSGAVFNW